MFVRCRIDYNAHQTKITYLEYTPKIHRVFKPIVCNEIDYSLKYTDRELINALFAQKGEADEIIIIKGGFVTDCSIGNLAFRKGGQWFTPIPLYYKAHNGHIYCNPVNFKKLKLDKNNLNSLTKFESLMP